MLVHLCVRVSVRPPEISVAWNLHISSFNLSQKILDRIKKTGRNRNWEKLLCPKMGKLEKWKTLLLVFPENNLKWNIIFWFGLPTPSQVIGQNSLSPSHCRIVDFCMQINIKFFFKHCTKIEEILNSKLHFLCSEVETINFAEHGQSCSKYQHNMFAKCLQYFKIF